MERDFGGTSLSDRTPRKLSLNRETVRQLGNDDLNRIVGGKVQSPPMNTANSCPVSYCICVTGEVCRDLSSICNN
jgi:hypothetical protein